MPSTAEAGVAIQRQMRHLPLDHSVKLQLTAFSNKATSDMYLCRVLLRFINLLLAVVGVAMAAFAVYMYVQFKEDPSIKGFPWYASPCYSNCSC